MKVKIHGKHVVDAAGQGPAPEPAENVERQSVSRKHRPASYNRDVQIAAAKVRVVTDKKLGETTPEWIVELSREEKSASAS